MSSPSPDKTDEHFCLLPRLARPGRDWVLAVIRQHGSVLHLISIELKKQRVVVIAAVKRLRRRSLSIRL